MKVYVYFNLHKKLYSIKALEGPNKGRVVAHARRVNLEDVRFHINEQGRDRVRQTGRKEVHAGLVGYLESLEPGAGRLTDAAEEYDRAVPPVKSGRRIIYNPHKYDGFVDRQDLAPITHSARVFMDLEKGVDKQVEHSSK